MNSPSLSSPKIDAGPAAEPLRSLRRGLQRAEGFTLFVAVVKTPAQAGQLIALLQDSIPQTKFQTVTLRLETTDILDEILQQSGGVISGPVMVVGLDNVLPSDATSHPVLYALNLRRPDWPQLLPQPVVFWVPEYLLGILALSAPDFLDWRSDTLHFPDLEPGQFQILDSATWNGGLDTQMPVEARLERIKELESRIAANEHSQDRIISATIGNWIGELGLHYDLLAKMPEAIVCYQKVFSIALELADRKMEGTALLHLGNAYDSSGDAHKAIEFYEQALAISRELGDRLSEGNALGNLGSAYFSLGDARKAIKFHEQALVISRETGNRRGEGNALGNLGNTYSSLGEARKAIEFHEQDLVISREIGNRRGESITINNLGNIYFSLGDARKAIEFHEQALMISREIGDRRGEGSALGNLGNAYGSLGHARKAMEFHEQALKISREIGDRRGEGADLWNLALTLKVLGNRTQAIARGEAALKINEAIEAPCVSKLRARLDEWREGK